MSRRVDQAQRIHRGEQRSPVAFYAVVDPLRLIHLRVWLHRVVPGVVLF